jgi:hypothetical protein
LVVESPAGEAELIALRVDQVIGFVSLESAASGQEDQAPTIPVLDLEVVLGER